MTELVPAYSSLTVYYDVLLLKKVSSLIPASDFIKNKIEEILKKDVATGGIHSALIKVPVLYDGADLDYVAKEKNIPVEEIIRIHSSKVYRVFMLGFLPGFPYMGETDERISVPRKKQPALKVEAGSVAIAGQQTGIYSLASPGGWQIIGRTPLKIFDVKRENPALFKAGDSVKFYSISQHEFESY
jgi:inhibitor of KinA